MKLTIQECDDLLEAIAKARDDIFTSSSINDRETLARYGKLQTRLRHAKNSLQNYWRGKL